MSKIRLISTVAVLALLTACSQTKTDMPDTHAGHDHAAHSHEHDGHTHSHDGHEHDGHDHSHHGHVHASNYTAWQNYRCSKGEMLKVRYDGKMAEVSYHATQVVLPVSKESNADLSVFGNGKWKWTVDSKHGFTNTTAEANGFLTADSIETVNGQAMHTDKILLKNCEPVQQ